MPSEQAENQLTLEPVQLYQFENQLRSFLDLEDGWFGDGLGRPYKKEEIERLIFNFKKYFDSNLPIPQCYARPDGQVLMGWIIGEYDILLFIDLENEVGTYEEVSIETNEQTWHLFFSTKFYWQFLNELLSAKVSNKS